MAWHLHPLKRDWVRPTPSYLGWGCHLHLLSRDGDVRWMCYYHLLKRDWMSPSPSQGELWCRVDSLKRDVSPPSPSQKGWVPPPPSYLRWGALLEIQDVLSITRFPSGFAMQWMCIKIWRKVLRMWWISLRIWASRLHGCMDAWMEGCMRRWMDALMDGWTDGWMHGCVDEWRDVWMHECMDRWMYGWMHGWMDCQTLAASATKSQRVTNIELCIYLHPRIHPCIHAPMQSWGSNP